ncbi:hypothetical protein TWF694_003973 [Orbilia ellipsospora]|uniref:[histone H3]-trimethyl-L-lysine(9) demethylase n=1 Tax=Orbilia ellipsospora TaxID=2528407 RepID=A0AAV9WYU0_9PEZI
MSTSAETEIVPAHLDTDVSGDNLATPLVMDTSDVQQEQPVQEPEMAPQSTEQPSDSTNVAAEEEDEDIGDIYPDHYWDNGKIPVFKPTMQQFKSFKKFIDKIDHYGMRSGIIKVIPPKEWRDSLPALDEKVKDIKIKNPIEQHIGGSTGIYRQANLQKQKTYNLPQWRNVCESSEHQPPARRGEKRKNQDNSRPKPKPKPTKTTRRTVAAPETEPEAVQRPLTPPPGDETPAANTPAKEEEPTTEDNPTPKKGRQPQAKPKRVYVKKTKEELEEAAAEAAEIWNGFNYRMPDVNEFTPERCEELERHYWRTLTYNSPMYGADMPGSLFEDSTTVWNVAHLENVLDCLPEKLPGVNTAYLYLGMWKATFSWHLEDVDLYSINYIHFGAPKQWYSISQDDAPKFAAAMKSIWPTEAKRCDQFLRHKTFLASPSYLDSHFNIKVNKLVHYEGEFVITFPFGYHAGYNLGYNCAESVNFATEAWLNYGRVAKKCECIDDAVWVDANDVERRYRGLPSEDEFFTEEEEDEDDDSDGDDPREPLTPPESVEGDEPKKAKRPKAAKKRKSEGEGGRMVKKIKVKFSKPPPPVCVLCPNNPSHEELLETVEGKKAHRLCAMYIPETYFSTEPETNEEKVSNVDSIPAARMQLKCYFCRTKGGACFQCSEKKCVRAYHATCAAAAGVLVESVILEEVKDESGNVTAPSQTELDFRCRFHRPKRPKEQTPDLLEQEPVIMEFAKKLSTGDIVQIQLYLGEIFAGRVVENRASEHMLLVEVLPKKHLFEVEWKYVLCTSIMKTNPTTRAPKARVSLANVRTEAKGKRVAVEPRKTDFYANTPNVGDQFLPGTTKYSWSEFIRHPLARNPFQEPAIKIWYYIPERSTENIPSWTKDPALREPDKDAFEPHLQRRSAQGEGPCYLTQAEEHAKRTAMLVNQQRQAAYYASQQQAMQMQQNQQMQNANRPPVPQALHTANWRQPAPPPPQPAGPIASTSNGQKFVVASAKGAAGKRVFYCPLQPTTYPTYQTTPHRVSYTNNTGGRVKSPANAARKSAAVAPAPAPIAAAMPPATNPQVPVGPPNVTVQPTPLSGATPS